MWAMTKIALIMSVALGLNGCATPAQRSCMTAQGQPVPEQQRTFSNCMWGVPTDLGIGGGGFRSTTVILPSGTYRVITSPGLTTISKTAR